MERRVGCWPEKHGRIQFCDGTAVQVLLASAIYLCPSTCHRPARGTGSDTGFFERMLEREYLKDADPLRGRFRSFLLTAFKHFLSKEWEKAKAEKRGGAVHRISLDFDSHSSPLPNDSQTPEKIFEREWAVTLLARVMHRLQRDMERSGKGRQFELLKHFLNGDGADFTFADVAAELGQSEAAARMAASRLRQRYRELLRDEIAQTLTSKDDIDDEIRSLFAAF